MKQTTDQSRVLQHIDAQGNAFLTLNRPDVHNAFDPEMVAALTRILGQLNRDPAVRAVVIRGAGKSFCAGADIAHMRASAKFTRTQNHRNAVESSRLFHLLYTLKKPTIAAVHGAVRGGGCGLVSACDIAVAARSATFRLSEVKIGIIPAMISPYVIGAIGERHARRYMMTGEGFDAAEACRIGMVHELVDDDALQETVDKLLAHLQSSGPKAVSAIKQLIPKSAHSPIGPGIVTATAKVIAALRATPEAQEGLTAFLEKRQPDWSVSLRAAPKKKKR